MTNINTWIDDTQMWCAIREGHGKVMYGKTEAEAAYWAGWWDGRRELGAAIQTHVRDGGPADDRCTGGDHD